MGRPRRDEAGVRTVADMTREGLMFLIQPPQDQGSAVTTPPPSAVPSPEERDPHPPKARLAFRVGVIGHGPDCLREADLDTLSLRLRALLMLIRNMVDASRISNKELFATGPATLRVVSSLAGEADRLVAGAALELGYELHCPMPFAQAEFEQDFEPGSLDRFRDLLESARRTTGLAMFELNGARADVPAARAAAGRVVLNQSDVLVAIGDGRDAAGAGETAQALREASSYHVPVLWIDATAPHAWRLLRTAEQLACLDPAGTGRGAPGPADVADLEALIEEAIGPPAPEAAPAEHSGPKPTLLESFFRERKPAWNPAFVWKLFRDAVGANRLRFPPVKVADFEAAAVGEWPDHPPGLADRINRQLRRHYAWADELADLYADRYRSTFVSAYLLGALAVFLALLGPAAGWTEEAQALCTGAELLVIAAISGVIIWGLSRRWHERWMEYRLVAELVRQLGFLAPLGGSRLLPRLSPHLATYGNPARTWMYWYLRAIERQTGLPSAQVTPDYLRSCLNYLRGVVIQQAQFHRTNRKRLGRIEHRLHMTGLFLFVLTGLACLVHFLPHGHVLRLPSVELWPWRSEWLTLLCAVLPALGAALAGINNQGEFARSTKQSLAMAQKLRQLSREIRALGRAPADPPFGQVVAIAATVAQSMVDEVLDWRVVFQDRPPVLPA
jgi:hypothetical protein